MGNALKMRFEVCRREFIHTCIVRTAHTHAAIHSLASLRELVSIRSQIKSNDLSILFAHTFTCALVVNVNLIHQPSSSLHAFDSMYGMFEPFVIEVVVFQ